MDVLLAGSGGGKLLLPKPGLGGGIVSVNLSISEESYLEATRPILRTTLAVLKWPDPFQVLNERRPVCREQALDADRRISHDDHWTKSRSVSPQLRKSRVVALELS